MELAITQLPPDVEYVLDGALDLYELDSCSYLTLRLYGDRGRLMRIVDQERAPDRLTARLAMCADLIAHADEILPQLPPETAGGLVFRGLGELTTRAADVGYILADWAINDQTTGGSLEEFRRPPRLTRAGAPTPRVARRLHSPAWIRRYVRRSGLAPDLRCVANRATRRALALPHGCLRNTHGEIEAAFRRQYDENNRRATAALNDQQEIEGAVQEDQVVVRWKPGVLRRLRQERKRNRKVIKRASVLAAGLLGAATVSAFARGEPVQFDGPTLTMQVQKRGSLAAVGHGQVAVRLAGPDGVIIADLCAYIDDTPAIDQLTGLALHMQAGLEQEIIEAANIINVSPDGLANVPMLAERHSRTLRAVGGGRLGGLDSMRVRFDTYWARTHRLWTDAVGVYALGPRMSAVMVGGAR